MMFMALQRHNFYQIIKFIFWGGLNTVLSILIYWGLVYVGVNIFIANTISVFICIFTGHFFNKRKVFVSDEQRTLRKYFLLWFCFYLLSTILLFFFVTAGVDKYIAAIFVGAVLVPVSFIFQKFKIFNA